MPVADLVAMARASRSYPCPEEWSISRIHLSFALCLLCGRAFAQAEPPPPEVSQASLDLGIRQVGLSFGNAPVWTGLRFNLKDENVRRINGLNITFWVPPTRFGPGQQGNPGAVYNGISLGVAPVGGWFRGITFGLAAAVSEHAMTGVNVGGLALVSEGALRGINFATFALVGEKSVWGLNIGGLAVVSEGLVAGVNLAGLAVVSEGLMAGFNLAGLAVVAEGRLAGISFSPVAVVGELGMQGLNLAGVALVSEGPLVGLSVGAVVVGQPIYGFGGGVALVSEGDMHGLFLGGLTVVAEGTLRGAAVSLGHVRVTDAEGVLAAGWARADHSLNGVTLGVVNDVRGVQRGLAVGVFNSANTLQGVQIGLLNRAGNNPVPFRWTPVLNAHFD